MQLAKLQITQQQAKTGISSHTPTLSIKQRPADMSISQELSGNLSLSTTFSSITIDQSQAFADAGLIPPLQSADQFISRAKQQALSYIAETTQHGEMLKKIENGTNAIPAIARDKGERDTFQFGYGAVPRGMDRVRINHTPSELTVRSDWPDPSISFRRNMPEISIPRWESQVYLQQKESIAFSVVLGSAVNQIL
ncbi:hypothetical protein FLK61_37650 [Paenalkalicoccus suaedae]|uniref:Uncharacterized protein n=1 Tax=Paenalkalicoccus suaedae TaxID=2592382 RepID=A0A859FJ03_9BACI|nr:DUF6470 family protein [Paenalkalicoccus suaedae]QKS72356.1 hypothetical protein FLK61_37650 [Paenalkalicoccus suaedae]